MNKLFPTTSATRSVEHNSDVRVDARVGWCLDCRRGVAREKRDWDAGREVDDYEHSEREKRQSIESHQERKQFAELPE